MSIGIARTGEIVFDTHTVRFGSALKTLNANDPDSMKAMVQSLKENDDENS